MATLSESLLRVLPGLFDDFRNAEAPKSATMAPVMPEDSLALQYLVADTDSIPDARDPVLPSSAGSRYKDVSRNFSRASVDIQIRDGFRAVIPDRIITSLAVDSSAVDLVKIELDRIVDMHWLAHVQETLTQLAGLGATAASSGTLVLTGFSAPLTVFFNTMINEIRLLCGNTRNLKLYVGMPVLQRLIVQNEIFDQGGLAIGTAGTADVNVRRLGAAEIAAVELFFRTKLIAPVELVVEDFIFRNSSAAVADVFSTGLYLAQASDMPSESCATTIAQTLNGATAQYGPFGVEIAETGVATGDRRGVAVGVDAAWTVKRWTTARGLKAATTLS